MDRIVVVGSGPSSVSCARALVDRGCDVVILDAGLELEPERERVVAQLHDSAPADWDPAAIAMIREGSTATAKGVPVKRVYGSDFPYRGVADHAPMACQHVTAFTSFARGGLSNVWGAAVVPYRPEDIADWPISSADLARHYEAVFDFIPLAAQHDALESLFPLHTAKAEPLTPSLQAKRILEHMQRRQKRLTAQGVVFGASRLAVRAGRAEDARGCVQCELCMYGCPYDLIYKSSHTLTSLLRTGRVTYIRDVVVDRVVQGDDGVTVCAHDRRTHGALSYPADRVFLGCGVLQTARIMLQSLPSPDATLTVRDSQYFLLPLLSTLSAAGVRDVGAHTLAQVFIELFDPALGRYPVHLQLYTFNDLYASAVRNSLGRAYPVVAAPAQALANRLMVIQGYLHSDLSSTASIRLRDGELQLKKQAHEAAAVTVRRAVRKLVGSAGSMGFRPLAPLLKIGDPGQGAHIGGTFPMRAHPGPLETDVLGRPYGFSRVHIVDASVLPSIPSTTITLNVMANAHRIGSECAQYVR